MELALSVMFSSPTLNIVVLTMLFSIFPLHLALLKLGGTFVLVLLIVPFISKNQPASRKIIEPEDDSVCALERSLNIRKNIQGTFHPEVVESMRNLANVYRRLGKSHQAMVLAKEVREAASKLIKQKSITTRRIN